MSRPQLPPYLFTRLGKKECSICRKVFPKDSKPSISKAFAEHVRQAHPRKGSGKDKANGKDDGKERDLRTQAIQKAQRPDNDNED
jgi:hypothetical protein